MIGRRVDGVFAGRASQNALFPCPAMLKGGGAGQKGRRDEHTQSRQSERHLCERRLAQHAKTHQRSSTSVITTMQARHLQRRFFAGRTCRLGLCSDDHVPHSKPSKPSPYPTGFMESIPAGATCLSCSSHSNSTLDIRPLFVLLLHYDWTVVSDETFTSAEGRACL